MAIPTLEKTWQHSVNNRAANTGVIADDHRSIIWAIKQALTGISPVTGRSLGWSNPWTVVRSSNSTPGGTGVGDNWNSINDVVWGLTAHSWIVLRQAGTNIEFCIDLSNNDTRFMTQVWSPAAGFTGGTQNTRPTATDQIFLESDSSWLGYQTIVFSARIHVITSTDGTGTRVLVSLSSSVSNATVVLFWLFDQVKNPVTGWANYNVALTVDVVSGATKWGALVDVANIAGVHGTTTMNMYMSSESTWWTSNQKGIVRSAHTKARNDFSNEWPLTPIGLVSETAGAAGRHGQLYDIWFGANLMHGKTYPDNLTKQFAQFHDIVLPWNGEGIHG